MNNNKEVKNFSEIYSKKILDGKKVKISEILNKPITVIDFVQRKSKIDDDNYLIVKFTFQGENYVFNTSSKIIREQLFDCMENLPFNATITQIGKYYTFS